MFISLTNIVEFDTQSPVFAFARAVQYVFDIIFAEEISWSTRYGNVELKKESLRALSIHNLRKWWKKRYWMLHEEGKYRQTPDLVTCDFISSPTVLNS